MVPLCAVTIAFAIGRPPCRISADKIALIFSAVEFIENHSLLEIVDARAAVSHTRRSRNPHSVRRVIMIGLLL